jgi:hypothetical protein
VDRGGEGSRGKEGGGDGGWRDRGDSCRLTLRAQLFFGEVNTNDFVLRVTHNEDSVIFGFIFYVAICEQNVVKWPTSRSTAIYVPSYYYIRVRIPLHDARQRHISALHYTHTQRAYLKNRCDVS